MYELTEDSPPRLPAEGICVLSPGMNWYCAIVECRIQTDIHLILEPKKNSR